MAGWSLRGVHVPTSTRLALPGDVGVHGQRRAVGERLDRGREAAMGEDRGVQTSCEFAELLDRPYPESVESAAYFIAAEALTNVAKYANASTTSVTATSSAGTLVLTINDDGRGGASPSPGGGLSGLHDRVSALGGTLAVDSPLGRGTRVCAEIPLAPSAGDDRAAAATDS